MCKKKKKQLALIFQPRPADPYGCSLSCITPPTPTPYGIKSWTLSSAPCHASPPLCESVSNGEHARTWMLPRWRASCILALCNNQYVRRNMFCSGGWRRGNSSSHQERGDWWKMLVRRTQSENSPTLSNSMCFPATIFLFQLHSNNTKEHVYFFPKCCLSIMCLIHSTYYLMIWGQCTEKCRTDNNQ